MKNRLNLNLQKLPRQSSQPSQQPQNQSPNLFNNIEEPTLLESFNRAPVKASAFLFKSILVIQFAFLLVFSVNFLLDLRLNYLTALLNESSAKILSYKSLTTDTFRLIDKIDNYKNLSASRTTVSDKVAFVIDKASAYTKLDTITVSNNVINIQASAESPVSFSFLINSLFSNNKVTAVVLKSASLDVVSKVFKVNIDVNY